MRRKIKNKKELSPDAQYNSLKVAKMVNYVMERGKKETARKVVYGAFKEVKEKTKNDHPLEVFETALKNVTPLMEVRSRRVGGANYQVPREVRPERRLALGLRWIVEAAEGTKGKPMHESLLNEIRAAHKGEGVAVTKKETTHRMAEANKAFAHFAW